MMTMIKEKNVVEDNLERLIKPERLILVFRAFCMTNLTEVEIFHKDMNVL